MKFSMFYLTSFHEETHKDAATMYQQIYEQVELAESIGFEKVWMPEWHALPEHEAPLFPENWLSMGNQILARDLIDAIEADREPLSSIGAARFVNEMVQGVYASHLSGGRRLTIPLTERVHPLGES